MGAGLHLQVVVVDATGSFIEVIADGIEHETAEVHGRTVAEVTTMAEVESHEGIAGFETRHEDRHVRLCAGVRLHIDVLGVIEHLKTIARDILRDIHYLAASVVTMAGIALGVLIGQHAAHGFHHLITHEILTRDQLNSFGLTLALHADDVKNLCVSIHTMIDD